MLYDMNFLAIIGIIETQTYLYVPLPYTYTVYVL